MGRCKFWMQQQQSGSTGSSSQPCRSPAASQPGRQRLQAGCLLYPGGRVELPPPPPPGSVPFLFDTAAMPSRAQACAGCPKKEKPPLCCGVCIFEDRRCEQLYPGQNRSEATLALLLGAGHRFQDFTPCELFQRIRGRTLWFMGDSQTWHYFYAAECFLRNFAPSLKRSPALPSPANRELAVTWPVTVPPLCLKLALGTRVCAVRVDSVADLTSKVLPKLHKLTPNFNRDIMVFNVGLHYPTPGVDGRPAHVSALVTHLKSFAAWRKRYRAALPALVWMDTPVQHFTGHDGSYNGGQKPFRCAPLKAWDNGNPVVLGGGRHNVPVAPLIPLFADAHLRTWNASVPLWDTHRPGECTHWCSPSAYHLWLYLLNGELRDSKLGGPVQIIP
ncbi:hypothetical protein C2E20_1286 [Micractinium conductrix]|uniref:Uncharacterized protein n=1 Tax=Micractinium conductrix TaxID=554055 RepID=A0A2P6VNG4_9CHLO|nr:hypothetical protein C2E20_1286 [Micractinium conductrix]|eukprot:PSC75638.1 hypothetical protein C2E20_1286 [Micractinium conductrix]